MPFLLRSVSGPFVMRDGREADDPVLRVDHRHWTPFLCLHPAFVGEDGELGGAELVVREISDDQFAAIIEAPDGAEMVVEGKPVLKPVAVPKRPPPAAAKVNAVKASDQDRPATMAATVPKDKFARYLAIKSGEIAGQVPPSFDAFESDTDSSATEPHDRPPVGDGDDGPPSAAAEPTVSSESDAEDSEQEADAHAPVDGVPPESSNQVARKGKRGRKQMR